MQKTVKLYDGSVTLHFSDQARNRYTIEETGVSPVGVTTVLQLLSKPALLTWPLYEAIAHIKSQMTEIDIDEVAHLVGGGYGGHNVYIIHSGHLIDAEKAYLKKSDAGKDAGTAIHAAIEAYLNHQEYKVPPEAEKALKGFKTWYTSNAATKQAVEMIVYSKEHNYAGTLDCILEIDNKVILCDIKTNNASRVAPLGIYPEHFLQLGAYAQAYREETGNGVDDVAIIRVGKEGIVNVIYASELELQVQDCEVGFINVLACYRFLTPLTKLLKEKKR